MAVNIDWLPAGHIALRDQALRAIKYVTLPENKVRFGVIEGTPIWMLLTSQVEPKFSAFNDAVVAWSDKGNRSPVVVETLKTKRKEFVEVYRKFYAALKANTEVTNADLIEMGFPKRHEGGGEPAPVETDAPECEWELSVQGRITLYFYKKGGKRSSAKPKGQHGVEIRFVILDHPPVNYDELVNSRFDVRSPYILDFDREDRGKTVYFAVRWENTLGDKGPWSPIFETIIP
ncbi:MAG: hypothetical protein LBS54_01180 [Dysgonamonadaceae bacterium]|jgi:hypothetical protein|nr:hypothetical protein [Dysgonamonadaceae bacterium]